MYVTQSKINFVDYWSSIIEKSVKKKYKQIFYNNLQLNTYY